MACVAAFFLRGVHRQARDSEERTVRLVELQHQLRNELLDEGRPNSVVRLAEQLFSIPVVTAGRVELMIGVTRPTAQAAIEALVGPHDLRRGVRLVDPTTGPASERLGEPPTWAHRPRGNDRAQVTDGGGPGAVGEVLTDPDTTLLKRGMITALDRPGWTAAAPEEGPTMNDLPELSSSDLDALGQLQRALEGQGTVALDPTDPMHRAAIGASLAAARRDAQRYPALIASLDRPASADVDGSTTTLVDAGADGAGRATAWMWHQAAGSPLYLGSSVYAFDLDEQSLLAYGDNTSLTGFLATSTVTATAQPVSKTVELLDIAYATYGDGTTHFTALSAAAPLVGDAGDATITVAQPVPKVAGHTNVVIALGRDSQHPNPDADYTFVEPDNVADAPYLIVPIVCQAALSYQISGTAGTQPSPPAVVASQIYFVKSDGSVITVALDQQYTPPGRLAAGVTINSADDYLAEVSFAADGGSYDNTSALVYGSEPLVNDQISYFFFQCQIPVQNAPVETVTFSVCSQNTPNEPSVNCKVVDQIQFWWHCLAAGTQVRLGDGAEAPIEALDNTDRVRTAHGGELAVEATTRGPHGGAGDAGPAGVHRLRTEGGRELIATGAHPIVTPVGLVAASDLVPGQQVLAEDGIDVVASNEAIAHEGGFHNLKLGDAADRAAAGGTIVGTFLANGIAVGDSLAMKAHADQRRRDLDFMLPRLDPAVRPDYASAVQDVRY